MAEQPQEQANNRNQRASPLRQGVNNLANRALKKIGKKIAKQAAKQITRSVATALAGNPVTWIIVGIILLVIIVFVLVFYIISSGSKLPPSLGGDIASCTFYRGGDLVQGTRFGNPQMAARISEISGKVGVPASIIAGIMRVETSQALTTTDTTYLDNDYDAHYSGAGAIGVMQFMAPTFMYMYNLNQNDLKEKFNKTSFKMTIDLQLNMAPKDVFRIYSIEDSITAAAYKVKNDKKLINGDGPWNEDTIKEIARRYYGCRRYGTGGCTSGPFDYGEDLWKSFTNCKPESVTPQPGSEAFSCPLQGPRTIGCGSFMSASKYNRGSCAGNQPIDRGHCGRNYGSCFKGDMISTTSQRRAHAIDVDGQPGEKVYLPTIEGLIVEWKYQPQASYPIDPKDGGGYGHVFTASVNGNNWELHLIHTSPPPLILPHVGTTYKSGDAITTIANTSYPHVHINIGKNPERSNGGQGWLDPESQLGMCTQ